MDLFEVIQARRSIRAYQRRLVEPERLHAILEAANRAPSAGNLQAYEIYVVHAEKMKRRLARAALGQDFVAQAPVVLVFCANAARAARYGERGATLYCIQDATVAVAYAQLAATALGLASCWVGAFDEMEVARLLGLPQEQRPIVLLPVGYAAEQPSPMPRRPLEDLVKEVPASFE